MADDIDCANAGISVHLSHVLGRHREMMDHFQDKASLTHCVDCGDEIPQGRRKAKPGCTHCIECAQETHMRKKI